MRVWLRSWKGGFLVAAVCLALGVLLTVHPPGGSNGWVTWACFLFAVAYGAAAVVDLRGRVTDRSPVGTGPVGLGSRRRAKDDRAGEPYGPATGASVVTPIKDRVGAGVAIAAAVVGLVLVMDDHQTRLSRQAPSAVTEQGGVGDDG